MLPRSIIFVYAEVIGLDAQDETGTVESNDTWWRLLSALWQLMWPKGCARTCHLCDDLLECGNSIRSNNVSQHDTLATPQLHRLTSADCSQRKWQRVNSPRPVFYLGANRRCRRKI